MATINVISHRVPFPPNKGEKLRTYHQLKFLRSLGHQLRVFSPTESEGEEADAEMLSQDLNIEVYTQSQPSRLLRYLIGFAKGQSLSEATFYNQKLAKLFIQKIQPDELIYCTASSLANYVFNFELDKRHQCYMDFMDVDSDKWQQYRDKSGFPMSFVYGRESRLIAELESMTLAHFTRAYVIADAERQLMSKNIEKGELVEILPNGISFDEFHPPSEDIKQGANLLFVGVMDYKPNVDAVLWFMDNCWPQIKKQIPDATFTIAGMNPVPAIQKLASAEIEVTGFVDEILPFFHRANVFVAPFTIARGVQNKVLQAMACGLPVVASTSGIEGIHANSGQHYALATTPEEFIQQSVNLLRDQAMAKEIGANAHKMIADNYSWQAVLQPLATDMSR